jgi:CRP-like cAMP-binding protein
MDKPTCEVCNVAGAFKNAILKTASQKLINSLRLQHVDMPVNLTLYEPNKTIRYAYFPERGYISVMSSITKGSTIEVGSIGREGMVGTVLLLETRTVPFCHIMHVAGDGYRVAAETLKRVAATSPTFRRALLNYEARARIQSMQGVACNGLHDIEQRCCRWLLMTCNRVGSSNIELSHRVLAHILGVRRASVTNVLSSLQAAGWVKCRRGSINILDRKRLARRACKCYQLMMANTRG